jgi:hypothetical protein
MKRQLIAFCVVCLTHAAAVYAQRNPQYPPDDPKLFHAFFLNPSVQQQAHINPADVPQVIALAHAAAQRLKDLDARLQSYLRLINSKKQNPDATMLQSFDGAQYLLDIRGRNDLRRGLSPQGLQELRAYLNGPFRDGVNSGAIPLEGPR